MAKIIVKDTEVTVIKINNEDYICITDMIKAKDGEFFVTDWLRNRNTLEYIGIWEQVYNPNFNYGEFAVIKNKAGLNSFKTSAKELIEKTNAISIQAKAGRYGGTYAHKDIAFEFAMWISPEFKIYIVKEFQRLKEAEQKAIGWTAKRELAKINYHIHTAAIKRNLIPAELTPQQTSIIYANEADVLNVALFGMTAKEWRDENPDLKGNIRDYATINELICLANMEMLCKREQSRTCSSYAECSQHSRKKNLNAVFINEGLAQTDRLIKLNQIAIQQMCVLENVENRKLLK
jgi:hypothetical protein